MAEMMKMTRGFSLSAVLLAAGFLAGCDGIVSPPEDSERTGRGAPSASGVAPPSSAMAEAPSGAASAPSNDSTGQQFGPPVGALGSAAQGPNIAPLGPAAQLEDERNTIQIFRELAPSVVFVTQIRRVIDRWEMRALEIPQGSGSGFIWDDKGHIVTNYHVIAGAQNLSVTLYDQKTYQAKVVGSEPRKDIAVLALIDAPKESLKPIRTRDITQPGEGVELEVGRKTVAIGNPFGLDHTLTTGVVSALGREVQGVGGVTIRDMIQTDAAINPGNSGGPLLDSSGYLIGMNTMIFSKSGASAGIGFAVPAATISRVVPQIIEHGVAKQVGIGVHIDPQGRLERRAKIKGVIVLNTPEDSPAAKAGVQGIQQSNGGVTIRDVIVGISDKKVENYDDLYNILDTHQEGDEVLLQLDRAGSRHEVKIRLVRLQ